MGQKFAHLLFFHPVFLCGITIKCYLTQWRITPKATAIEAVAVVTKDEVTNDIGYLLLPPLPQKLNANVDNELSERRALKEVQFKDPFSSKEKSEANLKNFNCSNFLHLML